MPSIDRRTFLGAVAAGSVAGLAGCSSSCPDSGEPEPGAVLRAGSGGGGFESTPDGSWPAPRADPGNTGYAPDAAALDGDLAVRWRSDLDAPEPPELYRRASAPTVAGGRVFATTAAGVVALNLRDGTEAWRFGDATPTAVRATFDYDEEFAPPVVGDGAVYVGTEDGLVALDVEDGTERWRLAGDSVGVPAVVDGTVYAESSDGLVAVDAADGTAQWTAPGTGALALLAFADGTLIASGERTVAVDAATGERRWSVDGRSNQYPVVDGGLVYLGDYEGLHALGLHDGEHRWTFERGGGREFFAPVLAGDTVYTVEHPGEAGAATFALDRTGGEPEPRWCSYVGDGAVTAATDEQAVGLVSGGGLDGTPLRMLGFEAGLGESVWGYRAREQVLPPAVVDGAVVAVDRTGVVAALGGE